MSGREYFVIDGDGYVSSNMEDDHVPEAFGLISHARKRARELAQSEPWRTTVVAEACEYFTYEPPQPMKGKMKKRTLQRKRKPHAKSATA